MYIEQSMRHFLDKLSSKSPEPGGGSAAALVGSEGAALVGMVAQGLHPVADRVARGLVARHHQQHESADRGPVPQGSAAGLHPPVHRLRGRQRRHHQERHFVHSRCGLLGITQAVVDSGMRGVLVKSVMDVGTYASRDDIM